MKGKIIGKLYFGAAIAAFFTTAAFAYLDPGTLTYVVSMIAGLVIAGGAALAIFRRKIVLFFRNLGKKNTETAEKAADDLGAEFNPMEDVVDPMAGDKD